MGRRNRRSRDERERKHSGDENLQFGHGCLFRFVRKIWEDLETDKCTSQADAFSSNVYAVWVRPLMSQRLPAVRLPRPLPPLYGDLVKPLICSLFIAIDIGHFRRESESRSDAAAALARIRNSKSNGGTREPQGNAAGRSARMPRRFILPPRSPPHRTALWANLDRLSRFWPHADLIHQLQKSVC
jgi:hypothetical protein